MKDRHRAQLAACEQYVYIPQHSDATASLNVNAACAVVLHHFAMWAALPEAPREGYKYVLGPPPSAIAHSGVGLKHMRTLNADGSVASHRRHLTSGDGDELEGAEDGGGVAEDALDVADREAGGEEAACEAAASSSAGFGAAVEAEEPSAGAKRSLQASS